MNSIISLPLQTRQDVPFGGEHARYLISFDFDGTLFDPGISLKQKNDLFQILHYWRMQNHILWGINTGRDATYLKQDLCKLMNDTPFAHCPDFVITMERYVYLATPGETVLRPQAHWNTVCAQAHHELYNTHGDMLQSIIERLRLKFPHLGIQTQAEDSFSIVLRISQIPDAIMQFIQHAIAPYPEIVVQAAGPYLRFSHRDYHKGSALEYVTQYFEIPPAKVAIFGDSYNDLNAMKHFPGAFLCCPINAIAPVQQAVIAAHGYVSPYPYTTGVLEGLKTAFARRAMILVPSSAT